MPGVQVLNALYSEGISPTYEETSMRIDDCTKILWDSYSCTNPLIKRDIDVHLSNPSRQ